MNDARDKRLKEIDEELKPYKKTRKQMLEELDKELEPHKPGYVPPHRPNNPRRPDN